MRFISAAVRVVQFENCSADYTCIADGAIIRVGGIRFARAAENKRCHCAAAFAETFDFQRAMGMQYITAGDYEIGRASCRERV